MALLDRFKKQPNDNLKYHIDYSAWLPAGVSVSNSVVSNIDVVNPASTDVGEPTLSISSPTIVGGTVVEYFASSGTDGKTYKVTFLATMTDTQELESEIEFRVTDR